jgi:Ran GTPase-activating protein (RanGAP) involved in mRNA processing and transport
MTTLDAPAAAVLAAALRANSTLTSLTLNFAGVLGDAAAAAELLGALTGHASLRVLSLRGNYVIAAHQAAAGASLGALLAANAPALTELDVSRCNLGDDGLRPLFAALPRNSHLGTLDVSDNDMSDAFAHDVLLPALRANASLRTINSGGVAADDIERELRSRAPL